MFEIFEQIAESFISHAFFLLKTNKKKQKKKQDIKKIFQLFPSLKNLIINSFNGISKTIW